MLDILFMFDSRLHGYIKVVFGWSKICTEIPSSVVVWNGGRSGRILFRV